MPFEVTCPHIIEHEAKREGQAPIRQFCGLKDSGAGKRTRIQLPFQYLDGEEFDIECPACGNKIAVMYRVATDGSPEAVASAT